ncbi:MAG: T9SS type A sorting domain-containing protein, partial [Bacteroidota bacterium]|nr:T9SS type A sorting domain-containing protein [Bacteroidota bacterium]
FVVKYDPSGNVLWAKSAGGIGYDESRGISTDASGNIVVTGSFSSPTITFGTTTLTNSGGHDIFVVKYDPSGNVLWAKSAGGLGNDEGHAISTDASGNIVVTGWFEASFTYGNSTLTYSGGNSIFVVKYDLSGNVLWAKSAGGMGYDEGIGISTDASGNIVVTGWYDSPTITFGPTTLTNSVGKNFFLVKYDPSGNVLWAKSAGGTGYDEGAGISTDASGNIVVTGWYDSPSLPFGATTLTNSGGNSIFVVKYDPSGNVLWAKSADGTGDEFGNGISTDASGNIVVTGRFSSPIIIFGITMLTNSGSAILNNDIFVVKYDPSGNLLWAKSAGGTGNDNVYGISTDASGNIVVTGWYDSPIITFGTTTLTSSGLKLIFVSKLSATTGLELYSKDEEMLVSPNPFNNATHIQLPESVQNAEITVCDLLGKKVLSKKCSGKECLLEKGTMNTGVYFMHINDEQRQYPITKIVVQ